MSIYRSPGFPSGQASGAGPRTPNARDLPVTLKSLLDGMIAAVEADAGAIYLLDTDHGDLELVSVQGRPESALGHRLAINEGLVGRAVQTGRSVVSLDVRVDPRALRQRGDWSQAPRVKSFLGVPLRSGPMVIGAVELCTFETDHFTVQHRARASALADAAALLIEQARLSLQPPPAALEDQSFSEDNPLGMLTLNSQLQVTGANPAFCRIVAMSVEAIVGRPAIAVLPILGRPRARDALEAAIRGASGHLGVARTADGAGHEQSLSVSLIPLGDPARGVVGVAVIVVDVSERTRLEAELREQNRRALEARDRLRTVVEVVSHELRTPLTSVLGYARLLGDRLDADEARRRDWAVKVTDKARMMARLVDEITDLARLGSASFVLRRETTDVEALIRRSVAEMEDPEAPHRFLLGIDPELPKLEADPDRLGQVLSNLLGNAVKFWPEGGDIEVAARRIAPDEQGRRRIQVSVADRGPGVDAEDLERIFEPFRRGKDEKARRISGTGLGLAVSRGIVEAHGGQIWCERRPGGGTVFRFWLPVEG